MNARIQEYIEHYIDLIDDNQFLELYTKINLLTEVGVLTATLMHCGIDILAHTEGVMPEGFLYNTLITKFEIPNEITNIERCAFARCQNLKEIILPKSLKYIGPRVFEGCINLQTIDWRAINLESCDRMTFNKCYSLSKIIFASTMGSWWALKDRCQLKFPSSVVPEIECTDGIINERI